MCCSPLLFQAEDNYLVVKLDLLALQWALDKAWIYLVVSTSVMVSDHQPPISKFNGKNFDTYTNPRTQRTLDKLKWFEFKLLWTPGNSQIVADGLSCILMCTVCMAQAMNLDLMAFGEVLSQDKAYFQIYKAILAHQSDTQRLAEGLPSTEDQGQMVYVIDPDVPNLTLFYGQIMVPKVRRYWMNSISHMQVKQRL